MTQRPFISYYEPVIGPDGQPVMATTQIRDEAGAVHEVETGLPLETLVYREMTPEEHREHERMTREMRKASEAESSAPHPLVAQVAQMSKADRAALKAALE